MPSILITGANRGIGLELARQYTSVGWRVHATCRHPQGARDLNALPGIRLHELDVTNHTAIDQVARDIDEPLDVIIANAGVMGQHDKSQLFGTLDYDEWRKLMEVNLYGAVHTCEAFTPHLLRGEYKRMVAITSEMGSIAGTSSGYTHYRTSKAALNMALMNAASVLSQKGIAIGIFHPGWVQTDMGGPSAMISTETCVTGLREQIDQLPVTAKPKYLTYSGKVLPW